MSDHPADADDQTRYIPRPNAAGPSADTQHISTTPPTLAYSQSPEPGDPFTTDYPPSPPAPYGGTRPAAAFQPQGTAPSAAAPVRDREPFDPGVDVPKYLGGAAVTAVVAGLLTYLGAVIIGGIMDNWIPASYWPDHGLARPVIDAALWAWTGAAAAILAAAVMWALIKVTPVPARFFSALSVLAAIGTATAMLTSGHWQTVILPAVLALIVVMVIGSLTALYTRYTITTPRRPQ